jgi:hypothetical protein
MIVSEITDALGLFFVKDTSGNRLNLTFPHRDRAKGAIESVDSPVIL